MNGKFLFEKLKYVTLIHNCSIIVKWKPSIPAPKRGILGEWHGCLTAFPAHLDFRSAACTQSASYAATSSRWAVPESHWEDLADCGPHVHSLPSWDQL